MATKPTLRAVGGASNANATENPSTGTHGGARDGAGRKPKALRYASELAQAEAQIITALPDVIAGLIRAAKGDEETAPDVGAAKYLLDRVFGRIKEQGEPLAEDERLPMSEADFELKQLEHEKMNEIDRMLL